MMKWYPDYSFILGSQSPRRQQLLRDLGLPFSVRTTETDETYPASLSMSEIPVYIAGEKASALLPRLKEGEMLITADTIVWLNGEVLGKPGDAAHAREILGKLSGKTHQVVTGVCLTTCRKQKSFFVITDVDFRVLSQDEIDHYIETDGPFDKAGAYGIQEWIGLAAITGINGSYFNVVGLPVHQLYEEIRNFDHNY
ncbi:MAG: Maf family nucleotide pyrophosphatase [Bacteroidota bacterium]